MNSQIDAQLRERLRKVEALFAGAATAGEKGAAAAALERLKAKLAEAARQDPPVELKFSLRDVWSVRLFTALCRRYGFKPYRYTRQHRTTVMVQAPEAFFMSVVWSQFKDMSADLQTYLEETTERLIRDAVNADTSDAEEVSEPLTLR